MKKVLIIILFFCLGTVYSQWSSNFWGNNPGDLNILNARGMAVDVDNSGKCYVAGYILNPNSGNDIAVIKYNSNGDTLWTRVYNGSANSEDKAFGIVTDDAGNIYVTGMVTLPGRSSELVLLKYSSNGIFRWARTYGATAANLEDQGTAIALDGHGNIYVTGFCTNSDGLRDILVQKYSPSGSLLFTRTEDGEFDANSEGFGIAVDSDNRIYVTGYTTAASGTTDIITLKYNQNGLLRWIETFNGQVDGEDKAFGIAVDESDNIYVTGYITRTANTANTDAVVIKYSPSGNLRWDETYNGNGNISTDKAWGIVVDNDENGVYITGQTDVASNELDYMTIKYTTGGMRKWVTKYNGTGNGNDVANAISKLGNHKIVITGASWGTNNNHDYATVRMNKNGNIIGVSRYSMTGNSDDIAKDVAVSKTQSSEIFVTGYSELIVDGPMNSSAISTVMMLDDNFGESENPETPSKFSLSQNYPNPFNPSTKIEFEVPNSSNVKLVVYDMLGKVAAVLVDQQLGAGTYNVTYTNQSLSSGIYFYELTAGNFREVRKMTLVK